MIINNSDNNNLNFPGIPPRELYFNYSCHKDKLNLLDSTFGLWHSLHRTKEKAIFM